MNGLRKIAQNHMQKCSKVSGKTNYHENNLKCKRTCVWFFIVIGIIRFENSKPQNFDFCFHQFFFLQRILLNKRRKIQCEQSESRYCTRFLVSRYNQSRICGKEVDLGLFPSDSLQSQSYQFIGIAHIGPFYGVEND